MGLFALFNMVMAEKVVICEIASEPVATSASVVPAQRRRHSFGPNGEHFSGHTKKTAYRFPSPQ